MTTPSGQPTPWHKNKWIRALIIVVVAVVIGLAVIIMVMSNRDRAAISACHEAAISEAKYPGAAEIISTTSETADSDIIAFHVSGLADFPNAFGTPGRHSYFCTAETGLSGGVTVTNSVVMEGDWINLE